jgi:YD repeat-containing protein
LDHVVDPYNERTTWSYDAASRPTAQRLGNGVRLSYSYDAAGQLTNLANLKSSGAVLSQFDYAYDPAGNRARVAAVSQTMTYRTT